MLCDFHTHSVLSDGVLSPVELIRRAASAGYGCIAITDHVGRGAISRVLSELRVDCSLVEKYWGIRALPGVELTHVPAAAIAELALEAREQGAQVVVVHGESPVEPVEPGTNHAAVSCPMVDILAHPGLIMPAEAELAAANGVFLEITGRGGHNAANGRVAALARAAGARLLVNSDAHRPGDLLSNSWARTVALGAGLTPEEVEACLVKAPAALLERIKARHG